MGIVEDSVTDTADNTKDLNACKDENKSDSKVRCEEVIEDVSVVESIDEFEFQGKSACITCDQISGV